MTVREKFPTLPSETIDQLDFVVAHFGREVEYVVVDVSTFPLLAEVSDGIPQVTCRRTYTPELVDVIHEVWHLYMKAKLKIHNYNTSDKIEEILLKRLVTEEEWVEIVNNLYSAVEHFYFLGRMNPDLNPYSFLENSLEDYMGIPETNPTSHFIRMTALNVVQLYILHQAKNNCHDELGYIRSFYPSAYDLGMQILRLLENFEQIENEPQIMAESFKILFDFNETVTYNLTGNTIILNIE
jgi:hypothetical protein